VSAHNPEFGKLQRHACGGFASEDRAEVLKVNGMLRTFDATQSEGPSPRTHGRTWPHSNASKLGFFGCGRGYTGQIALCGGSDVGFAIEADFS